MSLILDNMSIPTFPYRVHIWNSLIEQLINHYDDFCLQEEPHKRVGCKISHITSVLFTIQEPIIIRRTYMPGDLCKKKTAIRHRRTSF